MRAITWMSALVLVITSCASSYGLQTRRSRDVSSPDTEPPSQEWLAERDTLAQTYRDALAELQSLPTLRVHDRVMDVARPARTLLSQGYDDAALADVDQALANARFALKVAQAEHSAVADASASIAAHLYRVALGTLPLKDAALVGIEQARTFGQQEQAFNARISELASEGESARAALDEARLAAVRAGRSRGAWSELARATSTRDCVLGLHLALQGLESNMRDCDLLVVALDAFRTDLLNAVASGQQAVDRLYLDLEHQRQDINQAFSEFSRTALKSINDFRGRYRGVYRWSPGGPEVLFPDHLSSMRAPKMIRLTDWGASQIAVALPRVDTGSALDYLAALCRFADSRKQSFLQEINGRIAIQSSWGWGTLDSTERWTWFICDKSRNTPTDAASLKVTDVVLTSHAPWFFDVNVDEATQLDR